MIDLINKIFQEAGLQEKGGADLRIYSHDEEKNYWIIVQYDADEIEKIPEDQIEIFIAAKKMIQDPTFDKNANLLILNKVESLSNINQNFLLRIEENPYHFKKNILYYSEEEKMKLINALGDSKVLSVIESKILDEKTFEVHKQNFDGNDFESLIYRIAIKIPFIKINAKQTNNLKSLEEINSRSLQNNKLNELLLTDFFSLTEDELSEINEEYIFEKLKTILPNENQ